MSDEPYVAALPVDRLFIDRSYQRDLDERRAEYIFRNWDPRLVGIIEVSERLIDGNPAYAVVSGQHRWAAASLRDEGTNLVCRVHSGLSPDEEAKLLLDLEIQQKKLTGWDKWKARKRTGDRAVNQIEQACEALGLKVTIGSEPTYIMCTSALERVYEQGGVELVANTLTVLCDVWPRSKDALRSQTVLAVSLILDLYEDDLDDGRLADAMSEISATQALARGKDRKASYPTLTAAQSIATALIEQYNAQPGRGRLVSIPAKLGGQS